MLFSTWLLFVAVALVAIASPGPAILRAISNSLSYGIKSVLLSSFGNVVGLFVVSTAAIFGLGAVLKTSTSLFLVLKLFGAGYLIYLGIKQWRAKANLFDHNVSHDIISRQKSKRAYFTEGFLIAVTNPKAILFFTALFPQFINTDAALAPQFLIMTLSFMALSFSMLMTYGLLASKAKRWFSQGQRGKWFNRLLGSLLATMGVGLLQLKLER